MNCRPSVKFFVPALLLFATAGFAAPPADSLSTQNEQLRQENERLKSQIEALQKAQSGAIPATQAPPATRRFIGTGAQSRSAADSFAPGIAAVQTAEPAPLPAPPPGYKLVPLPPASEAYSETGCTHGLIGTTADGAWKDPQNWEELRKGMSMSAVEGLLGIQHYDFKNGNKIGWRYGACGKNAQGLVVFQQGSVLYWQSPDV